MEELKALENEGRLPTQQQLQFQSVTVPGEFTRAAVLHAVTKLIATNNQVS
jgi:hypothetical protein